MSSLIFYTDEELALVATDTLVVSASDRTPYYFASKALYLPHLKTIVACTGLARILEAWLSVLNGGLIVSDILELDYHTPRILSGLFQGQNGVKPVDYPVTATVYHIGFSGIDHKIHSFAYRSANNFKSEPLQYGLATKPECAVPEGKFELVETIPNLMKQQRDDQKRVDPEGQANIGGEMYAMRLTADGCQTFKLGVFDDYPAHRNQALQKAGYGT